MQEAQREINLSRIRKSYNVPAYLGVRIVDHDFKEGTIIGASPSEHLKVQLDEGGVPDYYHPTSEITYMAQGLPFVEIRTRKRPGAVIRCPTYSEVKT